MTSDESVDDPGPSSDEVEEPARPTGEVFLAPVPHSALIGLMAEPVSRSIRVRRSTVLMLVAFCGFGTLTLLYPPAARAVTTITTTNPNGIIPGLLPATTTTTHPATTPTTAAPVAPSTTIPASTTTSPGGPGTTTTTPAPTTTTSATPTSTTRSGGTTTSSPSSTVTSTTTAP